MPSKSKKQHNLMMAVAHSPKFAKKVGIPQSVGQDFAQADEGKKFRKGGSTNPMESKIANPRVHHGEIQLPNASLQKYVGLKQGGLTQKGSSMKMKETMGPRTMKMDVEKGSNKLLKHGESGVQKRAHTKGTNLGDDGKRLKIQGGAKGGAGTFGAAPVKMAKGGAVGPFKKAADGIASRGKTKGAQVAMCMGGKAKAKK